MSNYTYRSNAQHAFDIHEFKVPSEELLRKYGRADMVKAIKIAIEVGGDKFSLALRTFLLDHIIF